MSTSAIKVVGVSKKFTLGHNVKPTLRHTIQDLFKRRTKKEFWALDDINFEISQGEAVGIIGNNGAGKSTLLKILSRITYPTLGRVEISGRLSSLLEIGTGFHPELTGRENVFLNGSLLGMKRSEIKFKFDEIVDFSGVEEFIDTPVKHFSSGMYTRLAFSVSAHLNTEILLVDEVLAVGDTSFQRKCLSKMGNLTSDGKTVLLVSHNHNYLEMICDRYLRLERGKLVSDSESLSTLVELNPNDSEVFNSVNGVLKTIEVQPLNDHDVVVREGKSIVITISNDPFDAVENQILRLEVVDIWGGVKLILNSRLVDTVLDLRNGGSTKIIVENLPLNRGVYGVNVLLKDRLREIDSSESPCYFEVVGNTAVRATNASSQVFANYRFFKKEDSQS